MNDYLINEKEKKKEIKENGQVNNRENIEEQNQEEVETPDCLLSTYRNYGFNDNNDIYIFKE